MARFVSVPISQVFAYSNILFLFIGIATSPNLTHKGSKTAKLWFLFYLLYFTFGFIATAYHDFNAPIMRTIIPVIYFWGFFTFFKNAENVEIYQKLFTGLLLFSSILTIYLMKINFDIDYGGIHIYKLDRAGGVYGDANNAALVSILTYIFVKQIFKPKTKTQKIIKIALYFVIFYSLVLTFSTTGLSVFLIILIVSNQSFFTRERLFLLFVAGIIGFITILNLQTITKDMPLTKNQRYKIDNLVNVVTLSTDKVDNSGRGELLGAMLEKVYENPFLGNGIDYSVVVRGHNTYIGIWADAGIFAFLLFVGILILHYYRMLQTKEATRSFGLSILIVFSVFMISLQSILNQPYLITVFAYLGYLIDRNMKESSVNPIRYHQTKHILK